ALDRQRSERLDLRVAFRQSGGVSGGPNGSRRGQLLDPRGQVCGLAHRRVVHAQITSDGPYDDLARVQAHPNLDEAAVGWPDTVDEVFGRVAVRRGEPKRRRRHVAGGLTTLVAEFDADGKLGATVRARRRQSRAALEAELRLRRVFVLAPRTLHARPPSSQAG